ncbi:hypothetical protein KC19_11G151900 [Ceratodon purpureus]|uniref:Uncharacterized protein n=1 Tax=Ceratodon purpureus TaxID=3225 RepID=A0A8T0GGG3_CERPU|nr:hypothetical protein KC19_11G151900 [Ceratodon purpureus]
MTTKKMYRYTKDTLLAFASLPSCQPRPEGIDPALWRDSINSDVVERNIAIPVVPPARGLVRRDSDFAYSKSPVDDIPEWRRPNGGGAILQSGPRRKPYEEEPLGNAFSSSYPPRPSGPWVDQNGPIRPPHERPGPNGPPGRWDRNGERDRERGRLPQEWDADEGGPGGKGDAGQRPWVERDGLLGSGNRPPPQGHNRIGRPADNYQPSRPLIKTPAYGRREDTDIVNDETFGFLETSNDDRSVEERKRRESFELMRKEQHRQLQEQKQPLTKSDNSTVNRKHDENSLWDNISHHSPPLSPIGKTVVPPAPTPPRPAVPPGFSKVVQQRLSANQTLLQQEDEAQGAIDPPSKESASIKDQTSFDSDKTDDSSSAHSSSSIADIKEVKCATPVAKEMIIELDIVETKVVVTEATEDSAVNGSLSRGESLSGKRSRGVPDMWSFSLEGQDGDSNSDIPSTEDAGSIQKESLLDKLFGNAAPTIIDDVVLPSDLLRDEPLIVAPDEDNWSGSLSKTSKFAHWFHTEEDKFTTSQTNSSKNLMSLFGNTEHVDDSVSVKKDVQSTAGPVSTVKPGFSVVLPMPVGPSLEDIEKGLTAAGEVPNTNNHSAPKNGFTGNSIAHNKRPSPSPPVFMTCEDIEQALLAEAAGSDSQRGNSRAPSLVVVEENPPKDAASASQHLLALLLKRPSTLNAGLDMEDPSPIIGVEQAWKKSGPSSNQANEVHTLEALFGKAFMSELQSSEAQMFSDESFTRQNSELAKTSFSMHTEDLTHKARSSGMDGPRDWLASSAPGKSGPGWNNMWPDSKDVEASGYLNVGHPPKESHLNHPVPEEFEDRMASAPPLPGLWGKNDAIKVHNNVFMDSLNGASPHFANAPPKQSHNDVAVKNNKPFPGVSIQHLGAPNLVQRNQQRPPLGSADASFSHPALRPQAFNGNGLDLGFDGFTPQQHIQPPSHSFHGPISHPPAHLMGQPQILQRPQFHYGMVMQEQEVIKPQLPVGTGPVQVPGHYMHGQHQPNQVPPGAFLGPFQSEFQRTNSKSPATGGYGGVGSVERWFGIDGRRGLMGPNAVFPQAPVGVEGDMKMRYG